MKNFLKSFKWWQWIIIITAIAVNVFIVVNACLNGPTSTKESSVIVDPTAAAINTIKENTINESNYNQFAQFIRKLIGHFGLFMVSGVLSTLSVKFIYYDKRPKYWLFAVISCIIGLFFAILTEIIQLSIPGRSGEVKDVLIDFGGYFLGALIISLIVFIHLKKSNKLEEEKQKV